MGLSTEELKYVCLVGTFLAGLCGMLALVFRSERYERRREVIFSYLNAFAGGIFLSVGLLHMMVDSTEDLEDYLKDHYCSDYEDCDPYPLGFFMVGMGYLSVFFIEKVVFAKIYKRAAKKTGGKLHIHSHDNDTKKCYDNVKAKESLSGNVYDPDVLEVESEWSEDGEIDQKTTNLYAVTLLCVISIHSLFAGLGLGISEGDSDIIAQMIAIIAHKANGGYSRQPVMSPLDHKQPPQQVMRLVSAGIPRIFHQSYRARDIQRQDWTYCSQSWTSKLPEWEYRFWMDDDNENLVKRFLPQYLDVYNTVYRPVMKADFARLLYMYFFGGVYADFDFELLRSLEEYDLINENNIVVLGTQGFYTEWDHSIPNAFMMSTPGHPFWAFCINMAMDRGLDLQQKLNSGEKKNNQEEVEAEYYTGPRLLHHCVKEYGDPKRDLNRAVWDPSSSIPSPRRQVPGEIMKDAMDSDPRYKKDPFELAKDRVAMKERQGTVMNFGFQGDRRVYVAYPWEFYPISWDGGATGMNSTLTGHLHECYRVSDAVGKKIKYRKVGTTEEKEQPVNFLDARAYCAQEIAKAGAFAVTYWTHGWL
eukprot:Nk52_evm6s160 gene=Nk52_evmTU6s160